MSPRRASRGCRARVLPRHAMLNEIPGGGCATTPVNGMYWTAKSALIQPPMSLAVSLPWAAGVVVHDHELARRIAGPVVKPQGLDRHRGPVVVVGRHADGQGNSSLIGDFLGAGCITGGCSTGLASGSNGC